VTTPDRPRISLDGLLRRETVAHRCVVSSASADESVVDCQSRFTVAVALRGVSL